MSCNKCVERCPKGVKVEEVVHTIGSYLELTGAAPESPADRFDRAYTENLLERGVLDEAALFRTYERLEGRKTPTRAASSHGALAPADGPVAYRTLRPPDSGMATHARGPDVPPSPTTSAVGGIRRDRPSDCAGREPMSVAPGRGPADAVPVYYPGCSLDGLGKAYEVTCQQVLSRLGLALDRIVDYNCCGATEVKNLSEDVSIALPARNLALARSMGRHQVVAACNGCVYSLTRANDAVLDDGTRTRINATLERGGAPAYDGSASVQHVLEYIYQRAGPVRVRAAVRKPLSGLTVAPYYGCLYTRPKRYTGVGKTPGTDDPEHPHFLDELLLACGATVIQDFSAKTILLRRRPCLERPRGLGGVQRVDPQRGRSCGRRPRGDDSVPSARSTSRTISTGSAQSSATRSSDRWRISPS